MGVGEAVGAVAAGASVAGSSAAPETLLGAQPATVRITIPSSAPSNLVLITPACPISCARRWPGAG